MPKVEPPVIVLEGNETWVIATFAPDALEVTQPSAEVNNQTKGLKKTTQTGEKVGNNESHERHISSGSLSTTSVAPMESDQQVVTSIILRAIVITGILTLGNVTSWTHPWMGVVSLADMEDGGTVPNTENSLGVFAMEVSIWNKNFQGGLKSRGGGSDLIFVSEDPCTEDSNVINNEMLCQKTPPPASKYHWLRPPGRPPDDSDYEDKEKKTPQ